MNERFPPKVAYARYEPSDRRFEVSRDPYSRERMQALTAAFREMEEEFPGVHIAFTAYGSLTKGKTLHAEDENVTGNLNNDIDLECFFDPDDLQNAHKELMRGNHAYAEAFQALGDGGVKFIGYAAELAVEKIFAARVQELLAERLRFAEHHGFERPRLSILAHPISLEGANSILTKVKILAKTPARGEANSRPLYQDPDALDIARYFHLDVGGGLKRYRQDFLLKLSKLPREDAERYWKLVNASVRSVERAGDIPAAAEKQFPATFDEAVAYYGLPPAAK